jgi:scyllo-inositol 2-dehydrogenase (NADP+)
MSETSSPTSPVRVGVVGLGRSGYGIHLNAFRSLTDRFQVVAVADTNMARAKETAAEFDCAGYGGIEELLGDDAVELVIVATVNNLHAPHVIQALTAGKHAVCEKPFGLTVADVDAMIAARKPGQVLAPFQNRRWEESFNKVREILRSGRLGKIVHIRMASHGFGRRWDWQTMTKFGGGQLNNNLPHPLDQAMEFFDDFGVTDPAEITVFADLRNTLSSGDAEDHVRLTLKAPRYPDAPMIDIEFTAVCPYAQENWLVMGTAGGLRGTTKRLEWKWVDWETMPERPATDVSTPDRSYNREPLEWQEASHECTDSFGDWPPKFYDSVYRAIRQGKPLVITPEAIRKRIAILEKARAAASPAE